MEQRLKDRQTADKVRKKLEAKSRLYDAVHNGEELDDYMRLENKLNLILRYFFFRENCLVDFDGKEIDRSRERRGDPRDIDRGRPRERHYSQQVAFFPFSWPRQPVYEKQAQRQIFWLKI